jgi:ribosomal protein S18 acetylase RimI-like enzyme
VDRPVTIRGVDAKDLDACYAISLATGLAGGNASHLYRDPRMMGHIYVAAYALLEPALTFVVEDRIGVAGFVTGTDATGAWEERLERDWWPALREQYADPADVPAASRTPDQRRAFMIHHPSRTPPAVAANYPAHLHLNLLSRLQRRGMGSKLLGVWLAAAQDRGARAFHVGVNRANTGAILFWRSQGFEPLTLDGPADGRTLWMGRCI